MTILARHSRYFTINRAMATAQSLASLSGLRSPLALGDSSNKHSVYQTKRAYNYSVLPLSYVSLSKSETFLTGSAAYHVLASSSRFSSLSNKGFRKLYGGSARCDAAVAESDAQTPTGEKFEYQAEVSRLLDLIVHSLYSHKEVFLRELVSNASDALDKMRFLSLTEPSLMDATQDLCIRIKCNPDDGTVTITDTGIGMTRDELMDSLGTIAQSGTAKFVKALKDKQDQDALQDSNLIGQFGVGFYSAFLVADKVTVSTKSPKSDKQFVWEAEADSSSYVIREESDPAKILPRGTSICLHLKPDEKFEYTSEDRIDGLVKNYSQFISFPIYTWKELSRDKEVEEIEEPTEEGAEPVKKTKTIQEKYHDWQLANETKPIWVRSPKEVSKEEYDEFYKTTFKEFIEPLGYTHFNTEGEIEFKSLLFIPGMMPMGKEDLYKGKSKNIRLYVKRVFISDEFDGELFPRYLSFVQGVVDSNDLPLNVSREILQESRIVRIMKKRLVRKTFDLLDEISERENDDYLTFWKDFGKYIKVGCIEDSSNHNRLSPLLRFFSNKSEEKFIKLSEYVSRMKEDQKDIYFLSADTVSSAKSAPFLEKLQKKDLEVLFLVDPVDEVAVTTLGKFEGKNFVDISKEDLDLGDEDKELEKETQKEFTLLCDWMKQRLGDRISKVQISNRIINSPCVLVAGKFGWSANMERLMKAQALADAQQIEFMKGRRVLEINPTHPIITALNSQCRSSPNDPKAERLVELLYQTAHLSSGFTPENPAEFGSRVYEMMALALGSDGASPSPPSATPPSSDAKPPTVEADVIEASEILTEDDPWKK